jgi:cytochrome c biogenesis protein CcdA/glutaredoxin
MKRIIILSLFFLITFFFVNQIAFAKGSDAVLFYGIGCPHCFNVTKYLEENDINLIIEKKEVYQNHQNAIEFNSLCDEKNISIFNRGVPMLYINDECLFGDRDIISYLSSREFKNSNVEKEIFVDSNNENENLIIEKIENNSQKNITMPILVGAAIVDAINPCAFAVLLILMTTILASGNRYKALFSGISFSISIFISYLLMGLGLYSVVAGFETSGIFMKIVGTFAILLGLFNLKDFFWYGKFFLMEVPLSWRDKLKSIIKSITNPVGAFIIGFLVSLFLLPCTSGPYIVVTGMLGHEETFLKAFWLLVLYNFIFIFPMIVITLGTYFGMNVEKVEEKRSKNLRLLHLIAGIIMIIMGIIIFMQFS